MIKTIIVMENNKQVAKQMTYEQLRELFMPMMYKHIGSTNMKREFNKIETDDFQQELEVELWKAFEQYDATKNVCFSTYVHFKLLKGVRDVTQPDYAEKNQHNGMYSIDAPIGSESETTFLDMHSNEHEEISLEDEFVGSEMISNVLSLLNDEEKEILSDLIIEQNLTTVEYSEKHGISRQAGNKRVRVLKEKLKDVLNNECMI